MWTRRSDLRNRRPLIKPRSFQNFKRLEPSFIGEPINRGLDFWPLKSEFLELKKLIEDEKNKLNGPVRHFRRMLEVKIEVDLSDFEEGDKPINVGFYKMTDIINSVGVIDHLLSKMNDFMKP